MSCSLHFALESFFHVRPSRHRLSKSVRLDLFMKYTFIPSVSNGILIIFWRSIFSQVLSPQTLCTCKSTITVAPSSLSFLLQLESPTRIKKYVRLDKRMDSEDTGINQITNFCSYLLSILLGGAYWRYPRIGFEHT